MKLKERPTMHPRTNSLPPHRQSVAVTRTPLAALALLLVGASGCVNSEANLSETALYANIGTKELNSDVELFVPQFKLWTDGAEKKRYIRLPENTQIDTSDMDAWVFPVGTELYKEFSRDGRRLETRLLRKDSAEAWTMVAYVWNEDESDAVLSLLGEANANRSSHDVPNVFDCAWCHGAVERPLGFSAIQLSHDGVGLTMSRLIERNLLTAPPSVPITLPGDDLDHQVLGALHANCGGCHSDEGAQSDLPLRLALRTDELDRVSSTPAYVSAVGQQIDRAIAGLTYYVFPRRPDDSLIWVRMSNRGSDVQMPPVGTEQQDTNTLQALEAWIDRLP